MVTVGISTVGPSVGADYSTLAAWELAKRASTNDIERAVVEPGVHNFSVILQGWTSAAAEIVGETSHGGDYTTGVILRRASGGTNATIESRIASLKVDNIVFDSTVNTQTSAEGIRIDPPLGSTCDVEVTNCIFYNFNASSQDGIYIPDSNNNTVVNLTVDNCLFYGVARGAIHPQLFNGNNCDFNATVRSCLFYESHIEVRAGGSSSSIDIGFTGCAFFDTGVGDVNFTAGSGLVALTFNYCATDESVGAATWINPAVTATNMLYSQSYTDSTAAEGFIFADITSATKDFSLVDNANNTAINTVPGNLLPATDWTGQNRNDPSSIGPDDIPLLVVEDSTYEVNNLSVTLSIEQAQAFEAKDVSIEVSNLDFTSSIQSTTQDSFIESTIGATGDYSTLAAWQTAFKDSTDAKRFIALVQPGVYTEKVTIEGWTGLPEIIGQESHQGRLNQGVIFELDTVDVQSSSINCSNSSLIIRNLVFRFNTSVLDLSGDAITIETISGGSAVTIDQCIFDSISSTNQSGIRVKSNESSNTTDLNVDNCLFYLCDQASIKVDFSLSNTPVTNIETNVTTRGCTFIESPVQVQSSNTSHVVNFDIIGSIYFDPIREFVDIQYLDGDVAVSLNYCIISNGQEFYDGVSFLTNSNCLFDIPITDNELATNSVIYRNLSTLDLSLIDAPGNVAVGFVPSNLLTPYDWIDIDRGSPNADAGCDSSLDVSVFLQIDPLTFTTEIPGETVVLLNDVSEELNELEVTITPVTPSVFATDGGSAVNVNISVGSPVFLTVPQPAVTNTISFSTIGLGRTYSSIAAWQSARQSSVSNTEVGIMAPGIYTESVVLTQWPNSNVILTVEENHGGDYEAGTIFRRTSGANPACIEIRSSNVTIRGITFDNRDNSVTSTEGIRIIPPAGVPSLTTIERCNFVNFAGSQQDGIYISDDPTNGQMTLNVESCLFYNVNRGGIHIQLFRGNNFDIITNINCCTFYDAHYEIRSESTTQTVTSIIIGSLLHDPRVSFPVVTGSNANNVSSTYGYCITSDPQTENWSRTGLVATQSLFSVPFNEAPGTNIVAFKNITTLPYDFHMVSNAEIVQGQPTVNLAEERVPSELVPLLDWELESRKFFSLATAGADQVGNVNRTVVTGSPILTSQALAGTVNATIIELDPIVASSTIPTVTAVGTKKASSLATDLVSANVSTYNATASQLDNETVITLGELVLQTDIPSSPVISLSQLDFGISIPSASVSGSAVKTVNSPQILFRNPAARAFIPAISTDVKVDIITFTASARNILVSAEGNASIILGDQLLSSTQPSTLPQVSSNIELNTLEVTTEVTSSNITIGRVLQLNAQSLNSSIPTATASSNLVRGLQSIVQSLVSEPVSLSVGSTIVLNSLSTLFSPIGVNTIAGNSITQGVINLDANVSNPTATVEGTSLERVEVQTYSLSIPNSIVILEKTNQVGAQSVTVAPQTIEIRIDAAPTINIQDIGTVSINPVTVTYGSTYEADSQEFELSQPSITVSTSSVINLGTIEVQTELGASAITDDSVAFSVGTLVFSSSNPPTLRNLDNNFFVGTPTLSTTIPRASNSQSLDIVVNVLDLGVSTRNVEIGISNQSTLVVLNPVSLNLDQRSIVAGDAFEIATRGRFEGEISKELRERFYKLLPDLSGSFVWRITQWPQGFSDYI